MTLNHKILMAIALLTVLFGAGACSSENMQQPDSPEPTGRATLGISIGIDGSTRAGDASGNGGYEPGTGYENFLDIANDNYRIYFFDKDNRYISTFKPLVKPTMMPNPEVVNNVYTYFYTFMGEVPSDLPLDFKLVVFANWEKYPEEDGDSFKLKKGVTTITDLCTHADSQFSHLTSPGDEEWLGPDRLIPFCGVREYDLNKIAKDYITDGKIQGGALIDLRNKEQALPLLRAMARVEVILDNEYASFSAVKMTKINDRGFCAPEKATLHTDYDHSYTWDKDFIRAVHLTGEDNSNDANPQPLDFKKVSARSVDSEGKTVAERWVAYVPEYKNIGTEDYTAIEVTLADPDGSATTEWSNPTRLIYFATSGSEESNNNNSQATATQAGRHDIERNNIYRFTITGMNADLKCEVDIQPFAEVKLSYDLGLMRDERGDLMVLPDNAGGYPDFFLKFMESHNYPTDKNTGEELLPQHESYLDSDNEEITVSDDYYAIVAGADGSMTGATVWLKDKDGCQVLTNFKNDCSGSENPNCFTREVIDYTGLSETTYLKDKGGEQQVKHYPNHWSIVYDNEGELILKDDNPDIKSQKRYLVESWDGKDCWIVASVEETTSEDEKSTIYTYSFRRIDENGNFTTGNSEDNFRTYEETVEKK